VTRVRTFRVTPLPRAQKILRIYQGLHDGWACGPKHRHEANVIIDVIDRPLDVHGRILSLSDAGVELDDPLWPKHCQNEPCVTDVYEFKPDDMHAVMLERLGARSDTGEEVLVSAPPVGAIVSVGHYIPARGADGDSLAVMTPDGLWYLDGEDRAGRRWTRTGPQDALCTYQAAGPRFEWRIADGRLEST